MKPKTLAALAGALVSALTIGVFVARSVAAQEAERQTAPVREKVQVVERDVTRLQAQREEDTKRQERMEAKLDRALDLLLAARRSGGR